MSHHENIAQGTNKQINQPFLPHNGWLNAKYRHNKILNPTETFSLCPFIVSFKIISLNTGFIQFFFHDFNMYIAPGQGLVNPLGKKIWCQQKDLFTFSFFFLNFIISWNNDFKYFFQDYLYVHCPRTGASNPWGSNFYGNRRALLLRPFEYPVLHAMFQGHLPVWRRFLKILAIYGHGGHLGRDLDHL